MPYTIPVMALICEAYLVALTRDDVQDDYVGHTAVITLQVLTVFFKATEGSESPIPKTLMLMLRHECYQALLQPYTGNGNVNYSTVWRRDNIGVHAIHFGPYPVMSTIKVKVDNTYYDIE